MKAQHLSDEAIAAFADGVLSGHARDRAGRHTADCADCAQAVRVQREAVWALRAAPAPPLPTSLLDRLRTVPQTTEIESLPTVIAPDGSTMLATFAPMAAFVPSGPPRPANRTRPIVTTAAVVALAGALTAGSGSPQMATPAQPGGSTVRTGVPATRDDAPVITQVGVFRPTGP